MTQFLVKWLIPYLNILAKYILCSSFHYNFCRWLDKRWAYQSSQLQTGMQSTHMLNFTFLKIILRCFYTIIYHLIIFHFQIFVVFMNVHHILATVIYVDWYSHDFILMATARLSDFFESWTLQTILNYCFSPYSHIYTFCSEFQRVYRFLEAPRLIPRLRPTSVTSFLCHCSLIFW